MTAQRCPAGGLALPFIVSCVLLAGCETAPPPRPCSLAFATDLPLVFRDGQALTPAILDGKPTTMLLDTGSELTMVTKATADRMALSLVAARGQMSGIGGSRGVYVFSAEDFQIGSLKGRDLPLMVGDVVISPGGAPVDGLLGSDFLGAYDLDLDFPERKVKLFKSLGSCPSPRVWLDQPLYQATLIRSERAADARPFVNIQVAGQTLLAAIDSGAPHTLIFQNAARRIGLRPEDLAGEPHFRARGVGPDMQMIARHVMPPMAIGGITLLNLPVAVLDANSPDSTDVLLGLDFLTRVHVWFSFSSHRMFMQFPPKPSPPLPK